ncbi:S-layer family protein, partial [Salmonella enterica]|nr:S-layer family protein [Salmonella enterica]
NVTVQTSGSDVDGQLGNITVNADILKTAGADATLTLKADNTIKTKDKGSIGASAGKLNLNLLGGNTTNNASITLGTFINISLNGGDFYAGPANTNNNVSLAFSNNGKITAGNITMDVARGLGGYAFSLFSDNNMTIRGPVSSNTGWGVTNNFTAGDVLTIAAGTGDIAFNATDKANGGSRVVLMGQNGVNISTANGNISLASVSGSSNSLNISSVTGDVNVSSAQNVTLNNVTINSGGDINLRAAGSGTAMLTVQSSNLTTNGGNISLDQQDHQISAPDGTTTTNPNAMVVDVLQSTLNAGDGDILINGYNPNICLTSASYNNTIRNGGIMVGVRNNSNLTGNNISLNMQLNGPNASYLPVFINGANITAKNDINIGSVVSDDATPAQIEIRGSGNALTAQNGNITLTNNIDSYSAAVVLNGSGSNTAITLNALNGSIILNGSSTTGSGVSVANATLNAQRADIHGQSTGSNTSANGFSITNTTLGGDLTDLTNVTLSSAGSAAGATNMLDSSVVNDANRNTLLSKSLDNMTVVDMNGTAIFDDSAQAWDQKYQTDAHPNAGWIFNNTTVNASNADLSGVGFTNSSLNMTTGDLIINNNGSVMLTNSIINALQGAVKANSNGGGITLGAGSITAKGDINLQANNAILMQGANLTSSAGGVTANTTFGNLDLTYGNISASKDINLHTLNGTLTLKGNNASSVSTITSAAGNINVTASNLSKGGATGIFVVNANINAVNGNVTVNGTTPGSYSGVRFSGSNITANSVSGAIDIYGQSTGVYDNTGERGSVYFGGENDFTANNINITGRNTRGGYLGSGMAFDVGSNTSFYGDANVVGYGASVGLSYWESMAWNFYGAKASVSGYTTGKGGGTSYFVTAGIFSAEVYAVPVLNINLHNTDINLLADVSSTYGSKVSAFEVYAKFNGTGNVNVSGIATDGNGIEAAMFSNTGLVGNVSIYGESDSGSGVYFGAVKSVSNGSQPNLNLTNATITGFSNTSTGVYIDASKKNPVVNLGNNSITGTSNTSSGIQVTGSNVSITNGSLNGTSGGAGSGINLKGGNNYTLSGANVSGQSANGSGIAVSGNLSVNDNV